MGLFKLFERPGMHTAPENQPGDPTSKHDASADDPELYCRTETITFPVRDEEVLVHVRDSSSASVLPKFIAELQPYCDTFKSLPEHAVNLCQRFGLDHQDVKVIETHLLDLAERGMLVSKSAVLEQCAAHLRTFLPGVASRRLREVEAESARRCQ